MIVRIDGVLEQVGDSEVVVSVGGLAYQLLVPEPASRRLAGRVGRPVVLHTLYYLQGFGVGHLQPVLLGFESEADRAFFQLLTTVDGLGPKAALRLLTEPVGRIARAIEEGDAAFLQRLPGLGKRRAQEVIARLRGKAAPYATSAAPSPPGTPAAQTPDAGAAPGELEEEVMTVLLQLGYGPREAERMLSDARARRPDLVESGDLIREIFARAGAERAVRRGGEA
ncbi:MAG TPA: Holliday junction branch migration protein RuvA [Bacillota bacterium]